MCSSTGQGRFLDTYRVASCMDDAAAPDVNTYMSAIVTFTTRMFSTKDVTLGKRFSRDLRYPFGPE